MFATQYKNCFCVTCQKDFHYLGIARHRHMHKEKKETCRIIYTNGTIYLHEYNKENKRAVK